MLVIIYNPYSVHIRGCAYGAQYYCVRLENSLPSLHFVYIDIFMYFLCSNKVFVCLLTAYIHLSIRLFQSLLGIIMWTNLACEAYA